MRKPCYDCGLKHLGTALAADGCAPDLDAPRPVFDSPGRGLAFLYLSKAVILRDEVYQGYPVHTNYMCGYLNLASVELMDHDAMLADAVRAFRLKLQDGLDQWDKAEFVSLLAGTSACAPGSAAMLSLVIGNLSEALDELCGFMECADVCRTLRAVVRALMIDPTTPVRETVEELCEKVRCLRQVAADTQPSSLP